MGITSRRRSTGAAYLLLRSSYQARIGAGCSKGFMRTANSSWTSALSCVSRVKTANTFQLSGWTATTVGFTGTISHGTAAIALSHVPARVHRRCPAAQHLFGFRTSRIKRALDIDTPVPCWVMGLPLGTVL